MILNNDNIPTTPKKVAQQIIKIQINLVSIDDEIDMITSQISDKEKEKIIDQYWKIFSRIEKKYLTK